MSNPPVESSPTRALVGLGAVFVALACAMTLWLFADLDRISHDFSQAFTELEETSIHPDTVRRLRVGIMGLGVICVLFAGGLVAVYATFSRRARRRLAEVFRQALDGDFDDGPRDRNRSDGSSEIGFDGSLASARRLGRAMRSHHKNKQVSQARLSRLAELMDVGVLLFDAERRPELASLPALRFLGTEDALPSEDMVATLFGAFEDQHDGLPDQAKAEIEIEGKLRPVHLRLQLFHLDESCDHGYLVLVRDQRVLEALDTDLRMATQLRALSRLYMGVAHDLKAPLNAMGLNLALLRDSLVEGPSDEDRLRRKWVAVVEEELARLQRETERLLAQTAPSRKEVAPYDLRNVLTGIHDLLLPQARQQETRVELSLPKETARVQGREDLVKQALLNVAINALEATPAGQAVQLDLRVDDGIAFVQIRDDGEGIPDQHRDHIFEIHFTTKVHGTGIGLYIAQSILESEGGTLVLKETSESGTVLESTLPLL